LTNEVYFMVPSGTGPLPKYEPYLMVPSTGVEPEVYLMNPTGQPLPPGGPEGGGGPTVWTLWAPLEYFYSNQASGSFTTTPGDYEGGGYVMTTPGGYTQAKLVAVDGAWAFGVGDYCGSLWVKTLTEAKLGGTGKRGMLIPEATAEWATVSVEIALGTDKKINVGYHNDTPYGTGYVRFRIYLAP
jgi:hypothetical protein